MDNWERIPMALSLPLDVITLYNYNSLNKEIQRGKNLKYNEVIGPTYKVIPAKYKGKCCLNRWTIITHVTIVVCVK